MASLILRLDSRTQKNGMQQVRMRISHKGTNSFYPTGVWIEPSMFDVTNPHEPICKNANLALQKNARLSELILKFNRMVIDMDKDALARMCASDIRDVAFGKSVASSSDNTKKKTAKTTDFLELFSQYALSRMNENTQRHYAYVHSLLRKYVEYAHIDGIMLEDVNYKLLCSIKNYIRLERKGECTRYKVESYMRTVYKEAERLRLINRDVSPYFDYRIEPIPDKDIDVLDVEVLRNLIRLNLKRYPGMERSRDMLMASFYLCGANLIDMYNMPKAVRGEAVFVRHKVQNRTNRSLHIVVEDELSAIIEKWEGKDRMFNLYDRGSNFYTVQRRLNRQLDGLKKILGTNINMELMRRTWATIASKLEVPDRVIDKSMGHVDSSVKDRFYEQYDWSRTSMYNRKIIDYVWEGVELNSLSV